MKRRSCHITNVMKGILWTTLFITFSSCDTSNNLTPDLKNYFVRYYGEKGKQEGVDLIVNDDDQSVFLLGNTTLDATGEMKVLLVKADWNGNFIWEKTYGGPDETAVDLEKTSDGKYVILSQFVTPSNGYDFKLLRIDENGDPIDSVSNGTVGNDYPTSVTNISDGGFIVTGSTDHTKDWAQGPDADDLRDIVHYRFDASLAEVSNWEAQYGPGYFDVGIKTIELPPNHFWVMGYTDLTVSGVVGNNLNLYYYSLDEFGLPGNKTVIEYADDQRLAAVTPAVSGYFLVGAHSAVGKTDIFISQLANNNGDLNPIGGQKNISLAGDITAVNVCKSSDGSGYLVIGNEMGLSGSSNIWLSKVRDIGGEVMWSASFGALGRNDDKAGAVAELPDGRILILGTVNLDEDNLKMALFKLNSEGKFAN